MAKKRRKHQITDEVNGAYVLYSRMNLAYFLMWHDQVLRVINDKAEALAEFERITTPAQEKAV